LHPTACGDSLCPAPFPRHGYHWHFDGFDLPCGAALLAQGCQNFPNQAFRFGRSAIGLQFHPEVTYQMICRWTTRGAERLNRPGARPAHEHLHGWFQHDRAVSHWLERFLPLWIKNALPAASKEASFLSRTASGPAPTEILTAAQI
jgi:GMP synthase (glutamine-hydrolysing)